MLCSWIGQLHLIHMLILSKLINLIWFQWKCQAFVPKVDYWFKVSMENEQAGKAKKTLGKKNNERN